MWFTDEAIAAWRAAPRTTPGGQARYSDLAIETTLTLRAVFHLALRQTEGLIGSVLQLLGLDLPVPEPVRASAATSPPLAGEFRCWNCRRRPAPPVKRSTCWSTVRD